MKNKVAFILIFCLLFLVVLNNNIFATSDYSVNKIIDDGISFVKAGNNVTDTIDTQALHDTSSFIFRILFLVGFSVAVAVGIILGIQFMTASAEDKAKVKEALIGFTVGCLVLFGAYGIWTVVIKIVQGIMK